LAVSQVNGDVDSTGTDFLTIFPWNNNDVDHFPVVAAIDFINSDETTTATVDISYSVYAISGDDITTTIKTKRITVGKKSKETFAFGSDSVYQYLAQGLNLDYPSTKIFVHSSSPISVFAHTYTAEGIGDTFAVLPTAMASKEYSFSLPKHQSAKALGMIYLLPTVADARISLTLITATKTRDYSVTVPAGLTDNVAMFGTPPKDFSLYATSDQPFLIVAAIRMLPASNAKYEFGCFMPIPLTSKNCAEESVNDFHITDLSSASYFTVTSPGSGCSRFQVELSSEKRNSNLTIEPGKSQEPFYFAKGLHGDVAAFRSRNALVEMVRYGGFSVSGSGAFLDNLPSVNQFVTGVTPYLSFRIDDSLTIFGDQATSNTAKNDGTAVTGWKQIKFFDRSFYYTTLVVSSGVHFFSSSGQYILHVSGLSSNYSQGFTPRFVWKGTAAPTPIPPSPSGQTATPTRVTPTGQSVTPTGVTPTGQSVTPTGQSVRPSGSPTTVVTPPKSGSNAAEAFVGLIAMALYFALII
uniref:PA14 domain-containing protein n=1 Tax=Enterobius vermicularis TaxID=51028 RepID=A0A0N4VKD9_ENTVE